MGTTHFSGAVAETGSGSSQQAARTFTRLRSICIGAESIEWIPATEAVTLTRLAAGQYVKRRAAAGAARTDQLFFTVPTKLAMDLASASAREQDRGPRVTSIDLIYRPGVVGLTSLTPLLSTQAYSDGVALAAVTDRPLTPLLAAAGDITFSATLLQVARFTVVTPFTLAALLRQITVDITIVLANTGTLDVHAAYVNFDELL